MAMMNQMIIFLNDDSIIIPWRRYSFQHNQIVVVSRAD